MSLQFMLAWWNLIFIVPFILALFYLGLFVFTGMTFGDADADLDADADVDADAGEVSVSGHTVEADADADHDVSHATAGAHLAHGIMPYTTPDHVEPQLPLPQLFLSLLGIGKIPISLALMIFMFAWGLVGFASNALLAEWLGTTGFIALFTIPLTLVVSLTLTGLCAALVAKVIPTNDNTRHRRQDLVGKSGEAIYDIDNSFGMASVRGESGDFFQIPCRVVDGNARIPKGSRIVIFEYDKNRGIFHVAPLQQ